MVYGRFSGSRTPVAKPPIEIVFEEFYPEVRLSFGPGWNSTWQKILCPIHVEDRPSASVFIDGNRWKCHACDLSEDSLDIIMREVEEVTGFREAQEWANARLGGVSQAVQQPVSGKSSRGVSSRPRFGGGGSEVSPRVRRRFGDSGS